MQTYRATVRGRFDGLGEEARAALLAAADEHDMYSAAFTEAGTLTYDRALSWFSFRCEVRVSPEEGAEAAEERAGALARRSVAAFGAGHRDLRCDLVDMDQIKVHRKVRSRKA
ncbi:DUF6204 family protein [Nocardiopsis potens]|uniref:DUF6204 family protein n=1 Tax=Nocardiopsis potens TaxID=1246458 RepID=UPI00034C76B3|nr:DUF6204 family protein [Nocardiopsis potens]